MPFGDVVAQRGHRRLVELLSRSVSRGTLPPSLIFAGSAGLGKRQTAIALAQALNCAKLSSGAAPRASAQPLELLKPLEALAERLEPLEIDACGRCAPCRRIARGVHPDVLVVEPGESGAIKIDQVRAIVDQSVFRPFEGRRRVVIVDQADALVPAAQNALLKTLEEPTPSSVFVLVTSRPDVLLPTVRSRCIRLQFAGGAGTQIDLEARNIAQRVLAWTGRAGDAASRLDAAKELLPKTSTGGAGDREQLSTCLHAMASLLRDVEVLSAGADAGTLANPDAREALDPLVPDYRGERGVRAFGAIDRALAALDRNAGVKIVADWLVLQL
jgi:DNA polymerase-3 subunit delta'